jgi:hypothetical protein
MKRALSGGAHRGPVALGRQRRTIRLVQTILVLIAAGSLMYAGYAWGRVAGFDAGRRATQLEAPRRPSAAQTVVLVVVGIGALAAALLVQGDGSVRVPTPARLDELTGRAERAAVRRAESRSGRRPSDERPLGSPRD